MASGPQSAYSAPPDPISGAGLLARSEEWADGPEPMSEDDLESWIRSEVQEAEQVVETLQPERIKAADYYDGEPFGDEVKGRSQVVSRDVHDTVHAILPSLLRIFFGPEHVAEFLPRGPGDEPLAEQMTDYVDYVLKQENAGFLMLHSVFKDALIKAQGVSMWWWEETIETFRDNYVGLDTEAAMLVAQDAKQIGAWIVISESEKTDPATGKTLIDVGVRRVRRLAQIRVEAVPPEEFLINQTARDVDSARFVARRQYKTVSDLVALGYDYGEVEEQAGYAYDAAANEEMQRRFPQTTPYPEDGHDPANRPVLYVEAYAKVDYDGDGIAELRQICTLGEGYKVVRNEPVDERPFALWCPDPVPHTVYGNSTADQTMDIQRVKSSILRKSLDSLASAITPRAAIVEGQVNIEDMLNNETGAVIRMRAPGMVQPFNLPYVGQEAMPMLEYWDRVKEARTGISKAAAGLDADALQSTTRAAVQATVNAAHQHIEMIARIFAETGLKRTMRGILRLACRYQDKERVVRLRGKWVQVSPASWNSDADLTVNVAVGSATEEEQLQALQQIAAKQEQILQQFGPSNPLVTVAQYRYTLAKMIERTGFRDPSQFFKPVDPNWQPPPPQPQESPEQATAKMLAEVQAQQIRADIENNNKKIESEIAMKAAELQLKREDMLLSDDRERDKNEADIILQVKEMELKYATTIDTARIDAAIERERMRTPDPTPEPGAEPEAVPAPAPAAPPPEPSSPVPGSPAGEGALPPPPVGEGSING